MFEWLFGKPKETVTKPSEKVSQPKKPFKINNFDIKRFLYTDGEKYYYFQYEYEYEYSRYISVYNLTTIDGELIVSVCNKSSSILLGDFGYYVDSEEDAEIFSRLKKVEEKDLITVYKSVKKKRQFIDVIMDYTDYCEDHHEKFVVDGYVIINKELLMIHKMEENIFITTHIPRHSLIHKYSININSETVLNSDGHRAWFITQLFNGTELKSETISESEYMEKYHHIVQLDEATRIEEVKQRYRNYIQWHLDYRINVNKVLEDNAADIIPPIDTYEKFKLFIDVKHNYFNLLQYPQEIQFDEYYPESSEFKLLAINYFEKDINE